MRTKGYMYTVLFIMTLSSTYLIVNHYITRKTLDLSHQNLTTIPPIPDYVEILNLSHNNIQYVNTGYLPRGIKKLDLSNNELNNLPQLSDLALEEIDVSHNYIGGYADSVRTHLYNPLLKKLNISNNRISGVLRILDGNLESLTISNNIINSVFIYTPLKELYATQNQLEEFYVPSTYLEYQDVSDNKKLSNQWLIDKPAKRTTIITDLSLESITFNQKKLPQLHKYSTSSDSFKNEHLITYSHDSLPIAYKGKLYHNTVRLQLFKLKDSFTGDDYFAHYYIGQGDLIELHGKLDLDKKTILLSDTKSSINLEISLYSDLKQIESVYIDHTKVEDLVFSPIGNAVSSVLRYNNYYARKTIYPNIINTYDEEDTMCIDVNTHFNNFTRSYTYPTINTNNAIIDNKSNMLIEQLMLTNSPYIYSIEHTKVIIPLLFTPKSVSRITNEWAAEDISEVTVLQNSTSILTIAISKRQRLALTMESKEYYDKYSINLKTGEFLTYKDYFKELDKHNIIRIIYARLVEDKFLINLNVKDITLMDNIVVVGKQVNFRVVIKNNGVLLDKHIEISIDRLK